MIRNILAYAFGTFCMLVVVPSVIVALAYVYPVTFMPEGKPAAVFGGFCSAVGLFFVIWSNYELIKKGRGGAVVIGRIKLSDETTRLVTTGPYAMCRNPMHMGLILFYLGLCCAINSLLTLIVPLFFLIFAYLFAKYLDEPRLKRDFKEEYTKWVQDVPQRFWPKPKKV